MKKLVCVVLCVCLCLFTLVGCGASKTTKLTVSESFGQSPLLTLLVDAFEEETGYRVKVVKEKGGNIDTLLTEGKFECALVQTQVAAEPLNSGAWVGGNVFYDTLLLVGPTGDPASVRHLNKYAGRDVLLHIVKAGFRYVHPSLLTPFGIREAAFWLPITQTVTQGQFFYAPDDGAQLLATASTNTAYTLCTRQTWALHGPNNPTLAILNTSLAGLSYQYTVLAKAAEAGKQPGPSQAFVTWMMGQNARTIVQAYIVEGSAVTAYESNIPAQ